MIKTLKKVLKRSKFLRTKVNEIRVKSLFETSIGETLPINARESNFEGKRLNILVPSINQEHIFGGISTALKFYEKLADSIGCSRRIITTDAEPMATDIDFFKNYIKVDASEDSKKDFQILPFSNRYNRTIPVGKNDVFVSTAWWTAYNAERIIDWQANAYNQEKNKMIYFIQDYEPGFYAWSSRYVLADSTYKSETPKISIFNSKLLYEFFEKKGYVFEEKYYFEPKLNDQLKNYLFSLDLNNRKKQILFYGRPSVARNAFEVNIEALKIWAEKFPDAKEWKVYSIGEKHPDVQINDKIKIESLGKLSLENYAKLMSESFVGISLMVSPHPSYPPLEMATFGMNVITNSYENKNLESFNKHIKSLENVSPTEVSNELSKLCDLYKAGEIYKIEECEYLDNSDIFEFIEKIKVFS